MCGIAGVYFSDRRDVDRRVLKAMGDSIIHRGPDGEGFMVDEAGPSVGLVSRRLAVIDVPGGRQPMTVAGGRYTVVYNGELFNADEVRRELESKGHRFATRCDTEVVAVGYAEWGASALERLNGMWAMAIWDRDERRLFLARDRLGVKPLVYARTQDGLVFGSELKAVMASGLIERSLDPTALPHYLSAFAVPEPYTLIRGVSRLPAGHTLTVDRSGVVLRQYWDCAAPEEEDRGEAAYLEETAELLEDSVRRRLVSDVPLGVLLSSGVDSSLIAAFAARASTDRLHTFTLGFDDPAADERAPARALARGLGTEHHEDCADVAGAASALPDLLAAYDEPGESLLQTSLISAFARKTVTVVLSGLGGDELYAAYPTHVAVNLLARLDRARVPLRSPLMALLRGMPGRPGAMAKLASMPGDQRVTARLMHQTPAALREQLMSKEVRSEIDLNAPIHHLEQHYDRARARDPLNRVLYVYLKTYLTDELLRATDAMSMLHSLEVRTPFLDYRLVERAMRMPAHHKMRLRQGKRVLRRIVSDVLSDLPQSKAKRGFAPPLARWLQGELGEQVTDVLTSASLRERGIFDPVEVERVLARCRAGEDRLTSPVMMVFSFEMWARRWLDSPASAATATPGGGAAATSVVSPALTGPR